MNAIVHADYAQQGAPIRMALSDDRIEIENPGLLPFGLTIEDILQAVSRWRNRVIGRVFHEAPFGDGVARSTAAVAKHAGLSQRATLTRLKSMTARGLLVETGTGPHDPKRQYVLA